jgi:hypothetical protein
VRHRRDLCEVFCLCWLQLALTEARQMVLNGDLITFKRAVKIVPRRRRGKRVHVGTLHRWRSRGLKGIRLPALRVGGVWMTSAAALNWFFQRLSEPNAPNRDVTASAPALDQGLANAGW